MSFQPEGNESQEWLFMVDGEEMIKPTLGDYIQAIKETQGYELFLAGVTVLLLGCTWFMESGSNVAIPRFWGVVFLAFMFLMAKYDPSEEIKKRAVAIYSQRQQS
ncbi:hypothetical protein ACEUAI_20185 [Aeromonas veronii]